MITKVVKNIDTEYRTWGGKVFSPNEEHVIPTSEWYLWAMDDDLNTDLASNKATLSNGITVITPISSALDYLHNLSQQFMTEAGTSILRVMASSRDEGQSQIFQGAGDNGGYGGDSPIFIEVGILDSSKEHVVTIKTSGESHLLGGILFYENAPKGATMTCEFYPYQAGYKVTFVKKVPLYKDNYRGLDFTTPERALVVNNSTIKIKVTNGTIPADFKVWGYLSLHKPNVDIIEML